MSPFAPDPVGLPGLAALALGALLFFASVVAARSRRSRGTEAGATRASASIVGILVQGASFFFAATGPQRVVLDPLSPKALAQAAVVAALLAGAVALFTWASRTMGREWSIVARTRADHRLVQDGPFRYVRHPIYVAMALFLLGLAIALGHTRQLLFAVPVFAIGTALRIRVEERLLRDLFGDAHRAYAARVKRIVPGLF